MQTCFTLRFRNFLLSELLISDQEQSLTPEIYKYKYIHTISGHCSYGFGIYLNTAGVAVLFLADGFFAVVCFPTFCVHLKPLADDFFGLSKSQCGATATPAATRTAPSICICAYLTDSPPEYLCERTYGVSVRGFAASVCVPRTCAC